MSKIVSFKATDDILQHLKTKANVSEYIRQLILEDMNFGIMERRIRNIIREYLDNSRPEENEDDISNEIDLILNM